MWFPIDSAPKDGRDVLLLLGTRLCVVGHYMPGGHCIEDHPPIDKGWYYWNGAMFAVSDDPIAWTSLPEIPDPLTFGSNADTGPSRG